MKNLMKKTGFFIIFLLILLANLFFVSAIVPDEDADGVPDENDRCPGSNSDIVDIVGCDCSQKTASDCQGDWCCPASDDLCIKSCVISSTSQAECREVNICEGSIRIAVEECQNEVFVYRMYKILLNREPDCEGFNNWVNVLNSQSEEQVFNGFIGSQEYQNLIQSLSEENAIAQYVSNLYSVILDRGVDDDGLRNWIPTLENKNITKWQAYQGFVNSQEYKNNVALHSESGQCISSDCQAIPTSPTECTDGTIETDGYDDTICDDGYFYSCYPGSIGPVRNINDATGFDAICVKDPSSGWNSWIECDSDNKPEKTGARGLTVQQGTVYNINGYGYHGYLCHQNGDYESWIGCNIEPVVGGAKATTNQKFGNYICCSDNKWHIGDCESPSVGINSSFQEASIETANCDPLTQPSPNWGTRVIEISDLQSGEEIVNTVEKCLPSCGGLGGKACCEQGCDSEGEVDLSYDCNYCCRNSCIKWNLIEESGDFLCKEAIPNHNNLEENRINVVFVGVNYEKIDSFKTDVINSIDYDGNNFGILSVEPFKSNKNKFNFFYVNGIGNVEGYIGGYYGDEASDIIPELSQKCVMNNKRVVALINWVFRSNAPGETAKVSVKDLIPIKVLVHEIGHSIGDLWDEYISWVGALGPFDLNFDTEQCYSSSFIECGGGESGFIYCVPNDDAISDCSNNAKWKDLIGRGCGNEDIVDCFTTEIKCENITYEYCTKGICLEEASELCLNEECIEKNDYYCYQDFNPRRPEGNLEVSCSFVGGCYSVYPFRPNFNTIMRDQYMDPYSFGPVNERLICNVIKETTGSAGGICDEY